MTAAVHLRAEQTKTQTQTQTAASSTDASIVEFKLDSRAKRNSFKFTCQQCRWESHAYHQRTTAELIGAEHQARCTGLSRGKLAG